LPDTVASTDSTSAKVGWQAAGAAAYAAFMASKCGRKNLSGLGTDVIEVVLVLISLPTLSMAAATAEGSARRATISSRPSFSLRSSSDSSSSFVAAALAFSAPFSAPFGTPSAGGSLVCAMALLGDREARRGRAGRAHPRSSLRP